MPPFVVSPHWRFDGRVDEPDAPLGFDRKAAATGVRFNGFYLFANFRRDAAGH